MEKAALAQEKVWFDKSSYDKAERLYFERMAKEQQGSQGNACPSTLAASGSLASEIAKTRQHIKQSLQCVDNIAVAAGVVPPNAAVYQDVAIQNLQEVIQKLEARVTALEERCDSLPYLAICPAAPPGYTGPDDDIEIPKESSTTDEKVEDQDVDLFGSDSEGEDTEAAKIREERLAAYAAKKAKKPTIIAKSNIILDVKPWDDETDMKEMEKEVRKIECDGLLWGAAQLVPLAFGIHKLQISCVVEDDKVSIDWLTEQIQEIEDYVQSVDIAAFNKV